MQIGNKIILILSQATIPEFLPLEMPGSTFGQGGREKVFSLSDNISPGQCDGQNISSRRSDGQDSGAPGVNHPLSRDSIL